MSIFDPKKSLYKTQAVKKPATSALFDNQLAQVVKKQPAIQPAINPAVLAQVESQTAKKTYDNPAAPATATNSIPPVAANVDINDPKNARARARQEGLYTPGRNTYQEFKDKGGVVGSNFTGPPRGDRLVQNQPAAAQPVRDPLQDQIDQLIKAQQGLVADRSKVRDTMSRDMDARSADATAAARARAGAFGAGNLGAATAMESTISRQANRDKIINLDAFDQQTQQQQIEAANAAIGAITGKERLNLDKENSTTNRDIERERNERERKAMEIAMQELENELKSDLNNDGKIAGRDTKVVKEEVKKEEAAANRGWSDEEQEVMRVFSNRPLQGPEKAVLEQSKAANDPTIFYKYILQQAKAKGMIVQQYITDRQNNPIDWVIDQTGQSNTKRGW